MMTPDEEREAIAAADHYVKAAYAERDRRRAQKQTIRAKRAGQRTYGVTLRNAWRERMLSDKRSTVPSAGLGGPADGTPDTPTE